jgi:hypothetical protein
LIVAGFSFSDEHINNLIFGTLEHRPRTHVYALQFDECPENADVVKRAMQRHNMIIVGPRNGVVGGVLAPWAPIECPRFMQPVFELEEKPAASGAASKSGRMKIGDFGCFCDFLSSMTAD